MDHLQCIICKEDVSDPRMCPKCTKFFCWSCFGSSLYKCAHCKAAVKPDQYIPIGWAKDLREEVRRKSTSSSAPADNCTAHPKKQLSIFCQTCCECLCGQCWKADHEGHPIVPIEAAHDQFRDSLNELLVKVETKMTKITEFRDVLCRDLALHRSSLEKLKVEEIIRTSELQRVIAANFEREFAVLVDPLESLASRLLNRITHTQFFVDGARRVANDLKLNSLVDGWKLLSKGPYTEDEEKEFDAAMEEYRSPIKERLNFSTPWKPSWDLKGEVRVKDCLSAPKIMKAFCHRDVRWSVCVNNPSAVCPVKMEPGSEDEARPSLQTITVFMEGRPSLKNYEFCIESIPSGRSCSSHETEGENSGVEEEEEEEEEDKEEEKEEEEPEPEHSGRRECENGVEDESDNEGEEGEGERKWQMGLPDIDQPDDGDSDGENDEDDAADSPAPSPIGRPARVSINRTEVFAEMEEIQIPVSDVSKWIDANGGMAFQFMVRPLTYQQKCEDLEIYLEKVEKRKCKRRGYRGYEEGEEEQEEGREEEVEVDVASTGSIEPAATEPRKDADAKGNVSVSSSPVNVSIKREPVPEPPTKSTSDPCLDTEKRGHSSNSAKRKISMDDVSDTVTIASIRNLNPVHHEAQTDFPQYRINSLRYVRKHTGRFARDEISNEADQVPRVKPEIGEMARIKEESATTRTMGTAIAHGPSVVARSGVGVEKSRSYSCLCTKRGATCANGKRSAQSNPLPSTPSVTQPPNSNQWPKIEPVRSCRQAKQAKPTSSQQSAASSSRPSTSCGISSSQPAPERASHFAPWQPSKFPSSSAPSSQSVTKRSTDQSSSFAPSTQSSSQKDPSGSSSASSAWISIDKRSPQKGHASNDSANVQSAQRHASSTSKGTPNGHASSDNNHALSITSTTKISNASAGSEALGKEEATVDTPLVGVMGRTRRKRKLNPE